MGKRIIKNLVSGPVTRLQSREPFEGARGHIDLDISKCTFCMRCMRECPSGCLVVNRSDGTWSVNQFECIACGVCVDVCAQHAITMSRVYRQPAYYKKVTTYKGTPPVKAAKSKGQAPQEAVNKDAVAKEASNA